MGPPEYPGGPLREGLSWGSVALVAIALLALSAVAVVVARRLRARPAALPPTPPPGPPPPDPSNAALDALGALAAGAADADSSEGAGGRLHDDVAGVLRTYAAARWRVLGRQTTTEEFAACCLGAIPATAGKRLGDLLGRCDLARFARGATTAADRTRLLDDAVQLVRATADGGDPS